MFVFGSGVLIGTPAGGSPINFGLAQEVSLNIATTTKALYGQYNFPVAIGAGTKKMTGKAKMARVSGQALGSLFFGLTPKHRVHADPVRRDDDRSRFLALHLFHDQPRDLRRRSGRRLRKFGAAAEGGGVGSDRRPIFGVGGRLHVCGGGRRRGGADLLHLHSRLERREHRRLTRS